MHRTLLAVIPSVTVVLAVAWLVSLTLRPASVVQEVTAHDTVRIVVHDTVQIRVPDARLASSACVARIVYSPASGKAYRLMRDSLQATGRLVGGSWRERSFMVLPVGC